MWLGIKLEGWLTLVALLSGPLLAILVQQRRDSTREADNRKRQIFHQLLLTLKVPMAPRHVDAINGIPLEFYARKEVLEAWRLYTSHLNNHALLRSDGRAWSNQKFDLLVELAYQIAKSLGYEHIDKAALKDNVYTPQGYEDMEEQFRQLRDLLLKLLRGQSSIPVVTVGPVQVENSTNNHPKIDAAPSN